VHSAAYASQEAVWLHQLLSDLGISLMQLTPIFEDNQRRIKLTADASNNTTTKHTDARCHHLCDLVDHDVISFLYCDTDNMIALQMHSPNL